MSQAAAVKKKRCMYALEHEMIAARRLDTLEKISFATVGIDQSKETVSSTATAALL